jgi:hypothetical protein
MKFKVAGEHKIEKVVSLKLFNSGNGEVEVIAVDDKGERLTKGSLCLFCTDGTVLMRTHVDSDFGFSLDNNGKIITR